MAEKEEQRGDQTKAEEFELDKETIKDLDIDEEAAEQVKGGALMTSKAAEMCSI